MSKSALIGVLLAVILFSGCAGVIPTTAPTQVSDQDQELALQTLTDFFRYLSSGKYQLAAPLYAGSYDWLINNNPEVSPADHATLLEYGCRFNGLQCLEARAIVPDGSSSGVTYSFMVEFAATDGSLFILGPCCGATETEQPPISQFHYHVLKLDNGGLGVTDLPPYVP